MILEKVVAPPMGRGEYVAEHRIGGVVCPFGVDRGGRKDQEEIVIYPVLDGRGCAQKVSRTNLCLCTFCEDKHCVLIVDGDDLGVAGYQIKGKADSSKPFILHPYTEENLCCPECGVGLVWDASGELRVCPTCGKPTMERE
ncbi:MAG: hypothetical protein QCI38_04770 [Candidatus Thermoplasmatota archaeon]|nr:hypothetical protein [Candidatus Thermoplasmatota archaeon]